MTDRCPKCGADMKLGMVIDNTDCHVCSAGCDGVLNVHHVESVVEARPQNPVLVDVSDVAYLMGWIAGACTPQNHSQRLTDIRARLMRTLAEGRPVRPGRTTLNWVYNPNGECWTVRTKIGEFTAWPGGRLSVDGALWRTEPGGSMDDAIEKAERLYYEWTHEYPVPGEYNPETHLCIRKETARIAANAVWHHDRVDGATKFNYPEAGEAYADLTQEGGKVAT